MTSTPGRQCFAIDVSADGRWVAVGTADGLHLWDAEERREVASRPVPVKPWWMPVFFAGRDRFLYYGAANFGVRRVEVVRTNAPDGHLQVQLAAEEQLGPPRDNMPQGVAEDGRSLIVGEYQRQTQNDRVPPTVWLWPDGEPTKARKLAENFPLVGYRQIPGSPWAMTTDLVAPDAWIWNFESGQRVRSLGIPVQVNSELLPNGRWVVTLTHSEAVVWEVGTWKVLSRWPVPAEESGSVVHASPDSRLLATRTGDGHFVLRTLPDGGELIHLLLPRPLPVKSYQFSPDSSRLFFALATGQVGEWDLRALRRELAQRGLDWGDDR
jgi:hypothetical protein